MGVKMLAAFLLVFHLATYYLHVIIYLFRSVTTILIYNANASVYFHLDNVYTMGISTKMML